MGYSELIKNFDKIRDYMREFYVFGLKSREQYNKKSKRSYDDEKRRIESYLSEYMGFHQTADGKNVYISVDTRRMSHDPLYKAWKCASFTDGDITLFFIISDILSEPSELFTLSRIVEKIDNEYLCCFEEPKFFDSSTVRKKLKEYELVGIIKSEKHGKTLYYHRAENYNFNNTDLLNFFSEASPCGVIGSFLLDRFDENEDAFTFKHHYIAQTMDSQILYEVFDAIHKKQETEIMTVSKSGEKIKQTVIPLRVFISVQSGRQYIMVYRRSKNRITSVRIDHIVKIRPLRTVFNHDELREKLDRMMPYIWGVSTQSRNSRKDAVEFTVCFKDNEQYIYERLLREKRCGTVERIDKNSARFYAEVYDANEMLTWIRSFICRITDISFSDKETEAQFRADLETMYRMYGVDK